MINCQNWMINYHDWIIAMRMIVDWIHNHELENCSDYLCDYVSEKKKTEIRKILWPLRCLLLGKYL